MLDKNKIILDVGTAPLSAFAPVRDLFSKLQKDFNFSLVDRLHIAPEVAMYRSGENEEIWLQTKTGDYVYQVHFDGEFLCWVKRSEGLEVAYYNVLKGLLKSYEERKIYWNKELYEIEKQKLRDHKKYEDDKLNAMPETTPEEKIVKETFKRIKKSKKHVKK